MQIFDPPPGAPRRPRLPSLPKLSWAALARLPRPALPRFARRPLVWVIAAETVVTGAFLLGAIHLLSRSLPASAVAAPLLTAPSPASGAADPNVSQLLPPGTSASPAPHPGIGTGSGFLGGVLSGLNQDQSSFEHQEWAALQALSAGIRSYIENVVLPAVEKAAHNGSASSRSP